MQVMWWMPSSFMGPSLCTRRGRAKAASGYAGVLEVRDRAVLVGTGALDQRVVLLEAGIGLAPLAGHGGAQLEHRGLVVAQHRQRVALDRKSTRLNSSH